MYQRYLLGLKWKAKVLSALGLMYLISLGANAALSGSYTIDASKSASSTNYVSFNDAVSDLMTGTRKSGTANGPGVKAAVVFKVAKGTYEEQVEINAISGASSTNTITFESASGSNKDVVLIDTSNNSASNYLIHLDTAAFITFQNLTLSRNSVLNTSTYTTVINIENDGNSNKFVNNLIYGDQVATTYPTTSQSVIYSNSSYGTTSNASNNTFYQNTIKYGSYSIYWWRSIYSSTGTPDTMNTFVKNVIDSNFGYACYINGQSNFNFNQNSITNNNYQYGIAMYLYYGFNTINVIGNKISNINGYIGIYMFYLNSDSTNPTTVANNMISIDGGSNNYYGIYAYQSTYGYWLNNSIHLNGTTAYSYPLAVNGYKSGSTTITNYVYNNIFSNPGSGFTFYTYGSVVTDEDHNVHYAPTIAKPIYSSSAYDLASYQTATGFGTNDLTSDPKFASTYNLHASSIKLYKAGKNLSAAPFNITKDFDLDTRATKPCIGADEFTPATEDLAAVSIDSPAAGFCSGTKDIYLKVTNSGINSITSFKISWSLGGTAQTDVSFSGTLASGADTFVKLGSSSFSAAGTKVVAIVKTVNGTSPDGNQKNDTAIRSIYTGLSGAYSVGGSTADFNTISDAVAALTIRGLCGSVVFNINDGTYTEQVSIPQIAGTSATKTITFQSKSLDPTKVIVDYPAGSPKNYVFQLKGADWVTINKLTITQTGSGAGIGVALNTNANNNTISGCFIQVPTTFYPSSTIYSPNDVDSGNTIINNTLRGGYYSVYMNGNYGSPEPNTIIKGNLIDSFYYMGIIAQYNNRINISNNIIQDGSATFGGYGIYMYYSYDSFRITNNYIRLNNGGYGFMSYFLTGSTTDSAAVHNNMIVIQNTSSSSPYAAYGIYAYSPKNVNFYYNSINNTAGTSNDYGIYLYSYTSGPEVYYFNNCVAMKGGIPLYANASSITYGDNNNYYDATGGVIGSFGGTTYNTLTSWRAATSFDSHAVAIDPSYKSAIDLHAKSAGINNKAAVIKTIKTDYDGDIRSTSTPDIGADEFTPPLIDAGAYKLEIPIGSSCGDSSVKIVVSFNNVGLNTITSMPIKYIVYNHITGAVVDSATVVYTGSLTSGNSDTLTVNSKKLWNTYTGGQYDIKFYTNLKADSDHSNDTSRLYFIEYFPHFGSPSALGSSSCGGSSTVSLIGKPAVKGDKLFWFDGSGALVHKGDTFKTSVTATTTYYLQAKADTSNEGADYSSLSGTNTYYNYNGGLQFDARKDIFIDSVDVYANTSGTVTVTVDDGAGTILGSMTSTVSGTGSAERIPVKIKVPTGTGYRMLRSGSATLNYTYNYGGGAGVGYPFSGKYVDVTGGLIGTYSYKWYYFYFYNWVVNDTAACASLKVPVKVTVGTGGKPTASISVSNTCLNDSAMFTDKSTISGGSLTGGTITFGDGTTGSIKAGGNTYHKYAKAGVYKVLYSAVGSGGCSDDTLITVNINRNPSVGFTASKVCEGDSASFVDTTTISGKITRTWYFDGVKSALTNQIIKNAFSIGTGRHYTSLIITNSNGCRDSITRVINVNPTPIASFTVDSSSLCKTSGIAFTADTTKATNSTFTWNYGDASTNGSGNSVTHSYSKDGSYTVSLSVTNSAGCSNKNLATKTVISAPAPTSKFSVKVNPAYKLDFAANDTTGTSYVWDFGDLAKGTGKTVSHTYANNSKFLAKLTVSNANKCSSTDTMTVTVTSLNDLLASTFGLSVAPNPFKDNTVISYNLPSTQKVTIMVTDVLGRTIANLNSATQNAGKYRIEFNANDYNLNAGIYMIRFIAGENVVVKQIESVR